MERLEARINDRQKEAEEKDELISYLTNNSKDCEGNIDYNLLLDKIKEEAKLDGLIAEVDFLRKKLVELDEK